MLNTTDRRSAAPRNPGNSLLRRTDTFVPRHIGPDEEEVREMLDTLGYESLDALIDATVPESIRLA